MRAVVNISLPKKTVSFVKKEAKRRKYASVSEFVRGLIRDYEEQLIFEELEKSRQEFREGKGKVLKSLKDLE
jgi:Arc/MetJ-type ribon-helix-helix transcriptional regulator